MTIRILYVDDEPDIREVASLSLGLDPDFEVRDCAGGAEALEAMRDWRPDLIMLDVMMPGMDGPTTFERLRDIDEVVPIVFITARTQERDVARLRGLGAAGVIEKPFDPMTLASEVRRFVVP
jgi:DNA-binding response OmpR family regulator